MAGNPSGCCWTTTVVEFTSISSIFWSQPGSATDAARSPSSELTAAFLETPDSPLDSKASELARRSPPSPFAALSYAYLLLMTITFFISTRYRSFISSSKMSLCSNRHFLSNYIEGSIRNVNPLVRVLFSVFRGCWCLVLSSILCFICIQNVINVTFNMKSIMFSSL